MIKLQIPNFSISQASYTVEIYNNQQNLMSALFCNKIMSRNVYMKYI